MHTRLRQNTITLTVSNAGSAILSFGIIALIGRLLGEDGLGLYATALAWVFPLSLIAEFGLGTLITRDIAQNPTLGNAYLRETAKQRLIIGGGICCVLIALAPLLNDNSDVVRAIMLSAPLIIVNPFYGAFTAVYRAHQVMVPIAVLNLGMLIVQVALTLFIFMTDGDIFDVLAINTLTSTGQLFSAWLWWRLAPPTPTQHHEPSQITQINIRDLIRRAYPFAIAGVLAALNTRIGVILLEQFADTGEVGYYAAVARLIDGFRMVPNAVFGALFPMLAGLATESTRLNALFFQIMRGLSIYSVLIALVCSLFSSMILITIFGESFRVASPVLQISAWGLLPALLRAGQTLYWYALARENVVNMVTVGGLALQITLSFWFIPAYGAVGLAWVILVTESAMVILLWLLRHRIIA